MLSASGYASSGNGVETAAEKAARPPTPPITIFEEHVPPATPPPGAETSACTEAERLVKVRATQTVPPKSKSVRMSNMSSISEDMSKAAQKALGEWGIFGDDDSGDSPVAKKVVWTTLRLVRVTLSVISGLVITVGVHFQNLEVIDSSRTEFHYLFKYCYFVGAAYPIYFGCYVLCTFTFRMAELHYFKEILAHYTSLIKAVWRVLATSILLLWHYSVFRWIWCDGESYYELCTDSVIYNATAFIISRSLSCILVYSVASLIAAGATKYISTHFYTSTHFKKLKAALEKEFQLQALSLQRRKNKQTEQGPSKFLGRISLSRPSSWGSFEDFKFPLSNTARQGRAGRQGRHGRPRSARSSNSGDDSGKMAPDGSRVIEGLVLDIPAGQVEVAASKNDESLTASGAAAVFLPRARCHLRSASADSSPLKYLEGEESRLGALDPDLDNSALSDSSSSISKYFTEEQLQQLGDVQMDINYDLLQSVQLGRLENADADDIDDMSEEEIERIRTAVVIKTYSSLISKHTHRTPEQMAIQLRAVRKFGAALYRNICGPHRYRQYITIADMCDFFSEDAEGRKSARTAWGLFANDPRERVTKDQVIAKVEQLYVERSDIATSLIDTESMMDSLESAMAGGLHFLCVAIYFLIWKVDVMQGFSAFSATVLAFSFIFGNSITQGFESLLFLFLQHPYDVGDNILVDDVQYMVKTISLLSTSFEDAKGQHSTIANCSLNRKEIKNLSRTPTHNEFVTFLVDVGIATALVAAIEERLTLLIKSHPSEYLKDTLDVKIAGFAPEGLKVKMFVMWRYTFPPDDWRRLRKARDGAMRIISDIVGAAVANGTADYSHRVRIAYDQHRPPTPQMSDDEKSPFHVDRSKTNRI